MNLDRVDAAAAPATLATGFDLHATRYAEDAETHAALKRLWFDQDYDLTRIAPVLDAAVAATRAANDTRGLLWSLLTRALFTYRERPLDDCWVDQREAATLAQGLSDARADRVLGICAASLRLHGGALEEADQRFSAMPLLSTPEQPDPDDCYVLHCRAVCAMAIGRLEDSFRANYANVQLAESIGSPVRRGLAAAHLAGCLLVIGSAEDSIAVLEPVVRGALDPAQHPYVWAMAMSNLAECYRMVGRHEEAYAELQRLLAGGLVQRFPRFAFNLYDNLLHLAVALGRTAEASVYLDEAWRHARRSEHGSHLGACHYHAASIALAQGDAAAATASLEQAASCFDGDQALVVIDDTRDNVYRLLADCCSRSGHFQRAFDVQKAYLAAYMRRSAYTSRGQLAALQVRHGVTMALRELQAERAAAQARERQLRAQVDRDGLTGLFNRRYLDETLPELLLEAAQKGDEMAVALVDLDFFKRVNDTHGHAMGDAALRAFARLAESSVRESDLVCRYGGEEFCVVLPHCSGPDAVARVERLLSLFIASEVADGGHTLSGLSFSCGVAVFPDDGDTAAALLALSGGCTPPSRRGGGAWCTAERASVYAQGGLQHALLDRRRPAATHVRVDAAHARRALAHLRLGAGRHLTHRARAFRRRNAGFARGQAGQRAKRHRAGAGHACKAPTSTLGLAIGFAQRPGRGRHRSRRRLDRWGLHRLLAPCADPWRGPGEQRQHDGGDAVVMGCRHKGLL